MGRFERERAGRRERGCGGVVGEGEESVDFGKGAGEVMGQRWGAGSRGFEDGRGRGGGGGGELRIGWGNFFGCVVVR